MCVRVCLCTALLVAVVVVFFTVVVVVVDVQYYNCVRLFKIFVARRRLKPKKKIFFAINHRRKFTRSIFVGGIPFFIVVVVFNM